jgi:hypothetical protein
MGVWKGGSSCCHPLCGSGRPLHAADGGGSASLGQVCRLGLHPATSLRGVDSTTTTSDDSPNMQRGAENVYIYYGGRSLAVRPSQQRAADYSRGAARGPASSRRKESGRPSPGTASGCRSGRRRGGVRASGRASARAKVIPSIRLAGWRSTKGPSAEAELGTRVRQGAREGATGGPPVSRLLSPGPHLVPPPPFSRASAGAV